MNFAGKPSFCAIAPINFNSIVSGRPCHLVLAHLLDVDHFTDPVEKEYAEAYMEFARVESENGSFIMMDNSAYELKEPYSPDKLIELGKACGAHAIVLPDYPFQHSSVTIAAAEKFAQLFKDAGFKNFFVPQSQKGDFEDWIAAYEFAASNPLIDIIGISILGVPVAWSDIEPAYARVIAMNELKVRGVFNSDKHHHFLGLNAGPALEIPTLLRMGVLDTVDSSGPVWAAINGHRYTYDADSYQQIRKLTNPVDFLLPFTKDARTLARIDHNLELTDELFNKSTYSKTAPWYAVE